MNEALAFIPIGVIVALFVGALLWSLVRDAFVRLFSRRGRRGGRR